jgi:hypothetical protein
MTHEALVWSRVIHCIYTSVALHALLYSLSNSTAFLPEFQMKHRQLVHQSLADIINGVRWRIRENSKGAL